MAQEKPISKQSYQESKQDQTQLNLQTDTFTPIPQFKSKKTKSSLLKKVALFLILGIASYGAVQVYKNYETNIVTSAEKEKILKYSDVEENKSLNSLVQADRDNPLVQEQMKDYPREVQERIYKGELKFFTINVIDTVAEDGDIVQVTIDNKPLGIVVLSHKGAKITLPLEENGKHTLDISALKDGGGGVTFGARTSLGETISKVLNVNETERWTLVGK